MHKHELFAVALAAQIRIVRALRRLQLLLLRILFTIIRFFNELQNALPYVLILLLQGDLDSQSLSVLLIRVTARFVNVSPNMLWQCLINIYYSNLEQLFHWDHNPRFMGLVLELIFSLVHEECAHI